MPTSTLSDRILSALKNNRIVAVIVVVGTFISALAQFTNSVDVIRHWLGMDGQARAIYRTLVADLANVERAMSIISKYRIDTDVKPLVLFEIQRLEAAAVPVCNARKSVSELGDTDTRKELDWICEAVDRIKNLSNTPDGSGAILLAITIDKEGKVKRLREKLVAKT